MDNNDVGNKQNININIPGLKKHVNSFCKKKKMVFFKLPKMYYSQVTLYNQKSYDF